MPVKPNLPLVVLAGAAGAAVLGILALQPPEEDLLRQAAQAHASTLGEVQDLRLDGNVAAVALRDGRTYWLQFEKVDARWTFARDLGRLFEKTVQDPHLQGELLQRLGARLAQRHRLDIKFKEGLEYQYALAPDEAGLAGRVRVGFQFPPAAPNAPPRRGVYVETFRWKDNCFKPEGAGQLFESPPVRQ